MADNGIVSVNLAVSDQLAGALASRSTHPRFLWLLNRLLQRLPEAREVTISNPLAFDTRDEALGELVEAGIPEALQATVSCANHRGRPKLQQHCGHCSQCVSRRFATAATGLEEYDLPERYGLDVLNDPLPDDRRPYVVSFVRQAGRIANATEDSLFEEFPELFDVILPGDPAPAHTAQKYFALHERHAASVVGVMQKLVASRARDIATSALRPGTLVGLVAAGMPEAAVVHPVPPLAQWDHSEDYRSITVRGEPYVLTQLQALLVAFLDEQRLAGGYIAAPPRTGCSPPRTHAYIRREPGTDAGGPPRRPRVASQAAQHQLEQKGRVSMKANNDRTTPTAGATANTRRVPGRTGVAPRPGFPRRVAFYARVSSEDQRNRETILTQVETLRKALEKEPSVMLAGEYYDDGVTGTSPFDRRPEGARLLEDCRFGRIDEVWFTRLNRLGRKSVHTLQAFEQFDALRIRMRGVLEPYESRLVMQILAAVAEDDRRVFLENSRLGVDRVVRAGRY
ncbi:MAG: recombinase family protein [Chloroflexi bacterium]|nr:recombinase family protein [Chloroflexota bacterium]